MPKKSPEIPRKGSRPRREGGLTSLKIRPLIKKKQRWRKIFDKRSAGAKGRTLEKNSTPKSSEKGSEGGRALENIRDIGTPHD